MIDFSSPKAMLKSLCAECDKADTCDLDTSIIDEMSEAEATIIAAIHLEAAMLGEGHPAIREQMPYIAMAPVSLN